MARHSKTSNKKSKSTKNIVVLTMLTTIIVMCFSLSKYESSVAGTTEATIALLANSVKTNLTNITGRPGDIFEYKITITNYEEENICEVSEEFNISLSVTTNLPLSIRIYKDENFKEELTANSEGYYEDDSFRFVAGEESEITIYIRIEWEETESDYLYSQELDSITLYTNITQLD